MAQKKGNPGCPCCESICLIQSNDLDNDADLDNNFTLSDGDKFAYHGDPFSAIQISNASETATANTPHPQSPYPPRVQIEFYGDNIGSQVRVILGGAIVVQVTVGDGTSDLDILDASDDSELVETRECVGVDRNEWHRLTVCYDPDSGLVYAELLDISADATAGLGAYYSPGGALGAYAAFGTGPSHVDNVYVRNFRFWRLWYCGSSPYTEDCHVKGDDWDYYYDTPERIKCFDCSECACPTWCNTGTQLGKYAVCEVDGFSKGSGIPFTPSPGCDECPDANGAYILTCWGPCAWRGVFAIPCSNSPWFPDQTTLTILAQLGGTAGTFFNTQFGLPVDKLYLLVTFFIWADFGSSYNLNECWYFAKELGPLESIDCDSLTGSHSLSHLGWGDCAGNDWAFSPKLPGILCNLTETPITLIVP